MNKQNSLGVLVDGLSNHPEAFRKEIVEFSTDDFVYYDDIDLNLIFSWLR